MHYNDVKGSESVLSHHLFIFLVYHVPFSTFFACCKMNYSPSSFGAIMIVVTDFLTSLKTPLRLTAAAQSLGRPRSGFSDVDLTSPQRHP